MIVKRKGVHTSLFTMKKKRTEERRLTKLTCNQCVLVFNSNIEESTEQHYAVILHALKKNTVEAILLLQKEFGNEILEVLTIKRWHKMLLDGRELTKFEP